jgi:hypothetical protein
MKNAEQDPSAEQAKSAVQDQTILLLDLPTEVLDWILDELDYKTLCKIRIVCKTFLAHVDKIKEFRQLGTIENGTVVLRGQMIDAPLSDRLFFNQSLPISIEGNVTIRCVDKQEHCFSLKSPCIIRSNATLRIADGTILELAPSDSRLLPLTIEDGSGGLVVQNATLKTKTDNPDGVFLNTKLLITFEGNCKLDTSGGILILIGGINLRPQTRVEVVGGEVVFN